MVETAAAAATPAKADPALFALIQTLADNKYWLGRRYAEWCTAAPALEAAVAAAAMAQDEIGHARSQYPLFRDFTGQDVEPEGRTAFHSLRALDEPFRSWSEFVAANFLVDTALTVMFEAAYDSSYDDLRNRARRIVGEEGIHWLHGKAWVQRLATAGAGSHRSLSDSLSRIWAETAMWFGPESDAEIEELRRRTVLDRDSEQLRSAYLERVLPVMDTSAIATPMGMADLPWDRWDGERRRLKG